MIRKSMPALAALLLVGFALSACGSDDSGDSTSVATSTTETTTDSGAAGGESGGGGGKGGTIEVMADPSGSFAYETGDLSTDAGEVEVDFDNPASLGHDVRIEDSGGNDIGGTEVISGSTTTATVDLEPGTYTYYCSVGSHRVAGMEATLTVK